MSKAGERDAKSCWEGSIPLARAMQKTKQKIPKYARDIEKDILTVAEKFYKENPTGDIPPVIIIHFGKEKEHLAIDISKEKDRHQMMTVAGFAFAIGSLSKNIPDVTALTLAAAVFYNVQDVKSVDEKGFIMPRDDPNKKEAIVLATHMKDGDVSMRVFDVVRKFDGKAASAELKKSSLSGEKAEICSELLGKFWASHKETTSNWNDADKSTKTKAEMLAIGVMSGILDRMAIPSSDNKK